MTISQRILVADDEPDSRDLCIKILKREGRKILSAKDGLETIRMLKEGPFDLLLLDLNMPGKDGMEVLEEVREMDVDVIVITAYASIDTAVSAMKKGARDYLAKPFTAQELRTVVENVLLWRAPERGRYTERVPPDVSQEDVSQEMVGKSKKMQELYDVIEKVAVVNTSVLIEGESGTGKELVARAIHKKSPRSGNPFIPINCGALPENLLETELFGHTKGAFTGAYDAKKGLFEAASHGTIFLDEISETSPSMQVKLLRVLQDKEIRPIGDVSTKKVDCRVVAATNKNLIHEVANGRFREDLFYRLSVISIKVPPLRERKEDIQLLVHHFIEKYRRLYQREAESITEDGMNALIEFDWPGNVRHLENVIERAVILERSKVVPIEMLFLSAGEISREKGTSTHLKRLRDIEREHIEAVLIATNWNKSRAAEILGIGRRTLYEKIIKYGISLKEEGYKDD